MVSLLRSGILPPFPTVTFEMTNSTLHSIFRLYSFLGIFSVTKNRKTNGFKTSQYHAVFNAFKMPLVIILAAFFIKNPELMNTVFKDDILNSPTYSGFLKFIVLVTQQIVQINSFFICLLQFLRRERITKLLNQMNEIELEEKFSMQFKTRWRKSFVWISSLFWIISCIQYNSRARFTFPSFLGFVIFSHSYVVMSTFLNFMKTFEMFVQICLKDFENQIMLAMDRDSRFDFKTYRQLLLKHKKIFELSREFNNVFGMQVTTMSCCVAILLSFQVIFKIFLNKISTSFILLLNSFFKLFKYFGNSSHIH